MGKWLCIAFALALQGCALGPDCYVGLSIFPPGPFVHCGVDATPEEADDEVDE